MTKPRLEGKIAIVTGASRGIGRAIAEGFVREGARVVIASRKQEALDAVVEEVGSERMVARACHAGDPDAIDGLIAFALDTFGAPDVLVNNAATNPYFGPMITTQQAAWEKTLDVNLRGYFLLAQAVAQGAMSEGKPASIVNVASIAGMMSAPFQGIYGVSKAGVISMTQTLAKELGGAGVRVNAIAPGLVDTKLASALTSSPELAKMYTDRAALGRYGQPEELVGPAIFLASDESSYVSGHTLVVDGGYTIG